MRVFLHFYLVPSKLALCVLQSAGGGAMSLLPIDPKPGIELKRFSFLRSLVAAGVSVAAEPNVCACVGDVLALSKAEDEFELLDEPVALGVW